MTHGASLRKNRLFDPIFRMFYPDPAYICSLRAGGSTHFLAPGKGGSPLSTPTRPTPHDVGTSGVRSCADFPRLLSDTVPALPKTERGPITPTKPYLITSTVSGLGRAITCLISFTYNELIP